MKEDEIPSKQSPGFILPSYYHCYRTITVIFIVTYCNQSQGSFHSAHLHFLTADCLLIVVKCLPDKLRYHVCMWAFHMHRWICSNTNTEYFISMYVRVHVSHLWISFAYSGMSAQNCYLFPKGPPVVSVGDKTTDTFPSRITHCCGFTVWIWDLCVVIVSIFSSCSRKTSPAENTDSTYCT